MFLAFPFVVEVYLDVPFVVEVFLAFPSLEGVEEFLKIGFFSDESFNQVMDKEEILVIELFEVIEVSWLDVVSVGEFLDVA